MNRNESFLEVQFPQEWVEQFEMLALQTGRTVSELVREAIAQYLGISEQPSSQRLEQLSAEFKTFQAELAELTQKVNALSGYSHLVTTLSVRLTTLEGMVAQSPPNQSIPSSSFQLIDEDEDDYDEPDEILTDFFPR
jgi:hypothetical protein